ncbi:hypothetical protein HanXRQr2_Chr13g0573381 [Helianthus annuus]|uniref:Uncharacterized protein n=1 Tax=Helianthus annuus TaxID=4232 RepID=A0A251SP88_HELAN|nr:hypothetical protein HanXRQr2_Chr13g0573381 [Helianthus annuus]
MQLRGKLVLVGRRVPGARVLATLKLARLRLSQRMKRWKRKMPLPNLLGGRGVGARLQLLSLPRLHLW